ncbi:PREDICTED: type-1 angiotensin II receptor-associated protein isoform X1 [Crocodylus porosus]|nr:PREDICTED: type-1 angiotensin II receptor-associated protein isoform X1 [Crocodylus porosus]
MRAVWGQERGSQGLPEALVTLVSHACLCQPLRCKTSGNGPASFQGEDRQAIVVVHWLLTIWACTISWIPVSYLAGNLTVLAVGVWAIIQRDSLDAICMFLTGLLLTILTDIIHISIFYPQEAKLSDSIRFSAGMAIFSLLLKPMSCFLVYQMYRERGGEYVFNLGNISVGQDRSAYQSIDRQDAPHPYPEPNSEPAPRPY